MIKRRISVTAIIAVILFVVAFAMTVSAEVIGDYKVNIDFVVWDKESKSTVSTVAEDSMSIVNLEENQVYAPRLTITNNSTTDKLPVITMNVNEKKLSWDPITVTPGNSKRYVAAGSYDGAGVYSYSFNIDDAVALSGSYEVKEPVTAEEQFRMGNRYYNGNGVEQSYEKAIEWYTKAATQGYTGAQYNLGVCYYKLKNYEKAAEWYAEAANQGHAAAQNSLGFCYKYGYGVGKNIEKALEWYTKAAEQNNAAAQYNLGLYYADQKDTGKAIEWYTKAANQGYVDAMYALGTIYEKKSDLDDALEWYKKAADQGSEKAQTAYDRVLSDIVDEMVEEEISKKIWQEIMQDLG